MSRTRKVEKAVTLLIKNWREFQHYSHRDPPWIKLHFKILLSRDWIMVSDASKLLAVTCMLIASRNEGRIPNDPAYMQRLANLDTLPDFKPLIKVGFLIIQKDNGKVLARASKSKQLQAVAYKSPSETEVRNQSESESERQKTHSCSKLSVLCDGEFEEFWSSYPRKVGKKAAFKAWEKAKDRPTLAVILAALEKAKQSADWIKESGQYIPHPSTWLNEGRWSDEPRNAPLDGKLLCRNFIHKQGLPAAVPCLKPLYFTKPGDPVPDKPHCLDCYMCWTKVRHPEFYQKVFSEKPSDIQPEAMRSG